MTHRRPARIRLAGLLLAIAAVAALSQQWPASSSSTAASPIDVLRGERPSSRGEAGGAVPEGTTAFDDQIPGVAKLDADLLGALRRAATDAAAGGVRLSVDSGWRSPAYQERLLREAVS